MAKVFNMNLLCRDYHFDGHEICLQICNFLKQCHSYINFTLFMDSQNVSITEHMPTL
jgi:hypothetical protein